MKELKPCPFCGKLPSFYESFRDSMRTRSNGWNITCVCGLDISCEKKAKQGAIDHWNKRLPSNTDSNQPIQEWYDQLPEDKKRAVRFVGEASKPEEKYTIEQIKNCPGAIPTNKFFHDDGTNITKKEYGHILIDTICEELKKEKELLQAEMSDLRAGYQSVKSELEANKKALRDIYNEAALTSGRVRQRYFKTKDVE